MEEDSFLTIEAASEGLYKEKGSKFLAFAYPVSSEDEVKQSIDKLKKQYHDARHHCYAFVLGSKGDIYRAGDDGEPAHSAGTPILSQIRSHEITNVLIVVVRYFGGTKLGVSGLTTAYKTAANDALSNASIVRLFLTKNLAFTYRYEDTNEVMRLVESFKLRIVKQTFLERCYLEVELRLNDFGEVKDKVGKIPSVAWS